MTSSRLFLVVVITCTCLTFFVSAAPRKCIPISCIHYLYTGISEPESLNGRNLFYGFNDWFPFLAENRVSRAAAWGCYQPMQKGLCRGFFERFYYEPSSRSCQSFIYSGCGDNGNNFRSYSECSQACQR